MYKSITDVVPTDDYKLILSFYKKEKRIFDISPILDFGKFSELQDLNVFKKVHISFDTVEWENGLDLDPEYLYEKSKGMRTNHST
ncbi:DUF2442 domain-containing protein [candidate division WOR-3 bacterium]|nr:DUF2442 domain-containing protein [candidate division WOR-3 bacterium]